MVSANGYTLKSLPLVFFKHALLGILSVPGTLPGVS